MFSGTDPVGRNLRRGRETNHRRIRHVKCRLFRETSPEDSGVVHDSPASDKGRDIYSCTTSLWSFRGLDAACERRVLAQPVQGQRDSTLTRVPSQVLWGWIRPHLLHDPKRSVRFRDGRDTHDWSVRDDKQPSFLMRVRPFTVPSPLNPLRRWRRYLFRNSGVLPPPPSLPGLCSTLHARTSFSTPSCVDSVCLPSRRTVSGHGHNRRCPRNNRNVDVLTSSDDGGPNPHSLHPSPRTSRVVTGHRSTHVRSVTLLGPVSGVRPCLCFFLSQNLSSDRERETGGWTTHSPYPYHWVTPRVRGG